MRAAALALLAALAVSVPGAAWAQPPDPHAESESLFQKGRDAMKSKSWTEALRLLKLAQKLEPGRGKLVNIAICEREIGNVGSALRHFREVLPQLPKGDDRTAIVKQQIAELTQAAPILKIDLGPAAPPGATLKLDDEPLTDAPSGAEIPVDPGKHVVTASAPGMRDATVEVTLAARERKTVSIELTPASTASTSAPPAPAPSDTPSRPIGFTLGIVALSVGGASLLAGIGTGVGAVAKRAGTAKQCPAPDMCPASVQGDIDTYNALGNASTATFVIGGALAATGVVLLLTSRPAKKPETAWIQPLVGPLSIGARGRF